jgi:hypothetical protein
VTAWDTVTYFVGSWLIGGLYGVIFWPICEPFRRRRAASRVRQVGQQQ